MAGISLQKGEKKRERLYCLVIRGIRAHWEWQVRYFASFVAPKERWRGSWLGSWLV